MSTKFFSPRLFVTQHIVTAHSGTLTAASVIGQGTTFLVRLPAAPLSAPEAIAAESKTTENGNSLTCHALNRYFGKKVFAHLTK